MEWQTTQTLSHLARHKFKILRPKSHKDPSRHILNRSQLPPQEPHPPSFQRAILKFPRAPSLILSQKGMSYQFFNTQSLKPPQRRLGFHKDFKPQGCNKGQNAYKTSHTFQAEPLQDPILSSLGLRDCEIHNGHLFLEGLKSTRALKDSKFYKG